VKRNLIETAFGAQKLTTMVLLAGSVALSGLAPPGAARSSPAAQRSGWRRAGWGLLQSTETGQRARCWFRTTDLRLVRARLPESLTCRNG
jgi:hypothetical protein